MVKGRRRLAHALSWIVISLSLSRHPLPLTTSFGLSHFLFFLFLRLPGSFHPPFRLPLSIALLCSPLRDTICRGGCGALILVLPSLACPWPRRGRGDTIDECSALPTLPAYTDAHRSAQHVRTTYSSEGAQAGVRGRDQCMAIRLGFLS